MSVTRIEEYRRKAEISKHSGDTFKGWFGPVDVEGLAHFNTVDSAHSDITLEQIETAAIRMQGFGCRDEISSGPFTDSVFYFLMVEGLLAVVFPQKNKLGKPVGLIELYTSDEVPKADIQHVVERLSSALNT